MKRIPIILISLALILSACAMPETNATEPPPDDKPYCGDGVCDGPENAKNCPEDCPGVDPAEVKESVGDGVYWVENPTSGADLYVMVYYPGEFDSPLPALVLVPGGLGDHSDFTRAGRHAQDIADAGFIVVTFDPDGRNNSGGEENKNGHIQQDGLAAVIRFTNTLPGIDDGEIGVVSFSFGVVMASGALARYADLPVQFFMDWEGPANRTYVTHGCVRDHPGIGSTREMAPCEDDTFWAEREAETFVAQITLPYQRLQFARDHSQDEPTHGLVMVNAAVGGTSPWVRLNDLPPNQTYDLDSPPPFLTNTALLNELVAAYAQELFALP